MSLVGILRDYLLNSKSFLLFTVDSKPNKRKTTLTKQPNFYEFFWEPISKYLCLLLRQPIFVSLLDLSIDQLHTVILRNAFNWVQWFLNFCNSGILFGGGLHFLRTPWFYSNSQVWSIHSVYFTLEGTLAALSLAHVGRMEVSFPVCWVKSTFIESPCLGCRLVCQHAHFLVVVGLMDWVLVGAVQAEIQSTAYWAYWVIHFSRLVHVNWGWSADGGSEWLDLGEDWFWSFWSLLRRFIFVR